MKTGMVYKIGLLMILLVPISAKAQWSFDIGTVEAYTRIQPRGNCWLQGVERGFG